MDTSFAYIDIAPSHDVRTYSHDAWKRLVAQVYAAGAQPVYVDVDGRIRAERIRPVLIVVTRAEGPALLCDRPMTAYDYAMTNHMILAPGQKTAPKNGGYDKHDFVVTFADGLVYEGRYDLSAEGAPSLEKHIADHMAYLEENAARLAWAMGSDAATIAADARGFLDRYEVGQAPRAVAPTAAGLAADLAAGRIVVMRNYAADGCSREPQV